MFERSIVTTLVERLVPVQSLDAHRGVRGCVDKCLSFDRRRDLVGHATPPGGQRTAADAGDGLVTLDAGRASGRWAE
jgi:hypothetical protein